MNRRAFSLMEVLLALALLGVLAAPAITLLCQSDTPLSTQTVRARRLADRLVSVLEGLSPEDLEALASKADDFTPFDPSKVPGVNVRELEGLAVQAAVRIQRHAGGRFGLDRLDLALTFDDGRRPQRLQRTVLRRNEPQLSALARVRLHGDLAELTDQELADGLEFAAHQDAINGQGGFAESSLYPAAIYPPLLAEFEPPAGAEALALRKQRQEALGDRMKSLTSYFSAGAQVPRPTFPAGVGVAH